MSHDFAGSHIPDSQFKLLTVSIVMSSLIIGVLLPNIETVLGLVGSTIGVTVCITLPAMLMHVIARQEGDRLISKVRRRICYVVMTNKGNVLHIYLITCCLVPDNSCDWRRHYGSRNFFALGVNR